MDWLHPRQAIAKYSKQSHIKCHILSKSFCDKTRQNIEKQLQITRIEKLRKEKAERKGRR